MMPEIETYVSVKICISSSACSQQRERPNNMMIVNEKEERNERVDLANQMTNDKKSQHIDNYQCPVISIR